MNFGRMQKIKFGTLKGTYSSVTDREYRDSQLTLTDYEAELAVSYFGKNNINDGNVKSDPIGAAKNFRLFPGGETVTLNLVFPKPKKNELRLYISKGAGFMPEAGSIWFMFLENSELWIGAMNESSWRSGSSNFKLDESDEYYQEAINDSDSIRITQLKARDIYRRDRNLALERMELSGFRCEFNNKHQLFISRFSKKPYLEAHHLIPLGLQSDFIKPLDTIHNLFCLCPYCHRAVHNAKEPIARKILEHLAAKNRVLDDFSLTVPELFGLYAVEKID
ncbi:MAG: HNH endonuclease [Nitrosomonadales bacterium]